MKVSLVLCICFVDRCLSLCPLSFWPLCCLFFFELRILINPLISSNSSCIAPGQNRQHNGQKDKGQRDNQRSTKHIHKTKDRVIRTPLKIGGELGCSGMVSSSCSTSDTRRVNLRYLHIFVHLRKFSTTGVFM
jgi:hypothetical protein